MFDRLFELPGQIIKGAVDLTAGTVAAALSLPLHVVQAAIDAGCKTQEEIEEWVERNM